VRVYRAQAAACISSNAVAHEDGRPTPAMDEPERECRRCLASVSVVGATAGSALGVVLGRSHVRDLYIYPGRP